MEIRWYNHLYVGDRANLRLGRIKRRLNRGRIPKGVWLITYAACEADQLDLLPAKEIFAPWFPKKEELLILGVADNYGEAVQLVCEMGKEAYMQGQGGNIRQYLNTQKES